MYRYKRGVKADYNRQGYVYFVSRRFEHLTPARKRKIRELCADAGGEYEDALFEFVTTDTTATAICMKHYVSKATLYRAVKRYYEAFPEGI
ncbi:MAG: hypothetical protein ACOX7M_06300 [Dysosmobacter sp.]|uniref:hypothetical protein n=1 Tax=Dysosmobacter sp. TaxID=2591382 RepID=UPI003D92362F